MSATCLHKRHIDLGAKMTSFFDWDMPLHYGSQIQEHQAVRNNCGLFDVSHMLAIDITGTDARTLVRKLYSNDPDKSTRVGTALYGFMLNENGFVLDDLICYVINEEYYRLVVNAGRREIDSDWIFRHAKGMNLSIEKKLNAGIIALQGPEALDILALTCPNLADAVHIKKMHGLFLHEDIFVARSGYTGEDGIELIGSQESIVECWDKLIAAGVQPCGLGARDSLRLEAGLCLYGHELSESINPLEAGLGWAVDWSDPQRMFIGRQTLEQEKNAGCKRRLAGLVLAEKGIMRADQKVLRINTEDSLGIITSGGFSPTLNASIALALLDAETTDQQCLVQIRDKNQKAIITGTTFVRNGKQTVSLN